MKALDLQVPSCAPSGGLDARCCFGTTPDGAFLCAGNSKGEVSVYETATGERVTHTSAVKVRFNVLNPKPYSHAFAGLRQIYAWT